MDGQEAPPRAELADMDKRVRVRFGPGPTHNMALPDAEKLLCSLRDKHPAIFGTLMLEVYGIELNGRKART